MADTPKLDMPEIAEAQSQKYLTHNEALRILDAIVQGNVVDKDLIVPPGSPSDGDTYIVGSPTDSTSDDWENHDDEIAYYQSSAWIFVTPAEGWVVYVQDEDAFYTYVSASDGWVEQTTTFLENSDTPSSYSGEAYDVVRVASGETALEFKPLYREFHGIKNGQPGAGEVLLRVPVTETINFPDDMSGSQGYAGTAPTDSAGADFVIKRNGTQFATMSIANGANTATFSTSSADETFSAGDVLTVEAPNPQETTMADVGFALRGTIR